MHCNGSVSNSWCLITSASRYVFKIVFHFKKRVPQVRGYSVHFILKNIENWNVISDLFISRKYWRNHSWFWCSFWYYDDSWYRESHSWKSLSHSGVQPFGLRKTRNTFRCMIPFKANSELRAWVQKWSAQQTYVEQYTCTPARVVHLLLYCNIIDHLNWLLLYLYMHMYS